MNIFSSQTVSNFVNKPIVQKTVKNLTSSKALLPIMLLETGVITGRTYQAHKRGGWVESRERATEEITTAVVWFGIITWLNKLFDFGNRKAGMPEIKVDAGQDVIRNPMGLAISKNPLIKNKLIDLKFTKVLAASLLGIVLCGHILPKVNQYITRVMLKKEKEKKAQSVQTPVKAENIANQQSSQNKVSFDNFLNKTASQQKVSFKNSEKMTEFLRMAAHNLENNNIWKLLSIDAGLFIGRGIHARNKDERNEILFRDFASTFFYMFAAPLTYVFLSNKLDKLGGKNTNLDPVSAEYFTSQLNEKFGDKLKGGMKIEEFEKAVLGETDIDLLAKVIDKFNGETLDIKDFKKVINQAVDDKQQANLIIQKAENILFKRPNCASKTLLVRSEVANALGSGLVNDVKIMTETIAKSTQDTPLINFSKKATQGASQSETKFISYKEIDGIKKSISEYAESIVNYAKKKDLKTIDLNLIQQMKNRNTIMKMSYMSVGLVISGFFLSYVIPKLQYLITQKKTGKNEFPGARDLYHK